MLTPLKPTLTTKLQVNAPLKIEQNDITACSLIG